MYDESMVSSVVLSTQHQPEIVSGACGGHNPKLGLEWKEHFFEHWQASISLFSWVNSTKLRAHVTKKINKHEILGQL